MQLWWHHNLAPLGLRAGKKATLYGKALAGLLAGTGTITMDAAESNPVTGGFLAPDDLMILDEAIWVEAAARRPQNIALAPAAVTVIGGESLWDGPAWTVPDRLRYTSGVEVAQWRHGLFDVGIRGTSSLNAPRTVALIDGRSFRIEHLGFLQWSTAIPLSDIDRIELVKGPSSVTYGANAFGGVIAITTRPISDSLEVSGLINHGQDGLIDLDTTASGPLRIPGLPQWADLGVKVRLGYHGREDLPATIGRPFGPDHPFLGRTGDDDLRTLRGSIDLQLNTAGATWTATVEGQDIREWEVVEDYIAGSDVIDGTLHSFGLRAEWPMLSFDYQHSRMDADLFNQKTDYST